LIADKFISGHQLKEQKNNQAKNSKQLGALKIIVLLA